MQIAALFTFILAAVKEFFGFLIKVYGKQLVIGTLVIAAYTIMVVTFVSTLNGRFSELLTSLPNNSFTLAGLSLVPNNAITCALIVVGLRSASTLAIWTCSILSIKVKAK